MKAIKLIILFLVLAALIVVILCLPSVRKKGKETFPPEDLIDIKEECTKIRGSWEKQSGWNEETYMLLRKDINQSKAMGLYSLQGFNTVNNCLRETSANKMNAAYIAALHAQPFQEKVLEDAYKGAELLCTSESMAEDTRIKKVLQLHKHYVKVKSFAHQHHTITPSLDEEKVEWKSFLVLQRVVLDTAQALRTNPLFVEMQDIPGFKQAVDEAFLKGITDSQREKFYGKLRQLLVEHFRPLPVEEVHWQKLQQVYKQFGREARGCEGELADLYVDWQEKIQQMQE